MKEYHVTATLEGSVYVPDDYNVDGDYDERRTDDFNLFDEIYHEYVDGESMDLDVQEGDLDFESDVTEEEYNKIMELRNKMSIHRAKCILEKAGYTVTK